MVKVKLVRGYFTIYNTCILEETDVFLAWRSWKNWRMMRFIHRSYELLNRCLGADPWVDNRGKNKHCTASSSSALPLNL